MMAAVYFFTIGKTPMRPTFYQYLWILTITWLISGCASNSKPMEYRTAPSPGEMSSFERLLAKRASITLEINNLHESLTAIDTLAQSHDGLITSKQEHNENRAFIGLSIPQAQLDNTLLALNTLGKVTSSSISSEDVTDAVIDTDAKLKNLMELRTKYRKLLDKSASVADLLAVEKELSRVQTEIDALQAQHKVLSNSVAMATVDIHLERKRLLGPLGYVGKGLLWITTKLFILD